MRIRGLARSSPLSALVLAITLIAPAVAQGQSLFSSRGLGLAVQPVDGRARGLGGVPMGLLGGGPTWANPAESVGLEVPGLSVAFDYDSFSSEAGAVTSDGSTARFPLILGVFPAGDRAAISVGAGGFLDQNFAVEVADTIDAGGDRVPVLDRFTSEGGVTQLRLAGAYRLGGGLSVGVGADYYLGGVERAVGRFYGDARPECCRASWSYSGFGAIASVAWTANDAVAAGASVSFGGTLDAETADSLGTDASIQIPTRLAAGASGRVAPSLLLGLGAEWTGWGGEEPDGVLAGGSRDAWSAQGGVEWDALRLGSQPLPVRLGGRYAALPFRWANDAAGGDWADERAITGGVGFVLGGGPVRADLALERGTRGGATAGVEESFWRTSLSVLVLGR